METHDTGRSQFDDVTRDNTPVIRFRLDDASLLYDLPGNTSADSPTDESIRIPFNTDQTESTSTAGYRVAVFIEGEPQQPDAEPQVLIGHARAIDVDGDGVPDGIYEFDFGSDAIDPGDPNGATTSYALTDGSHFISAKVQIVDPDDPDNDPLTLDNLTAYGTRSDSLEIVVDTIVPPAWFGDAVVADDGLHPDSDTGIEDQADTFVDRITSDTTPSFWGTAEADTVVYVYADLNDNDVLELDVDLLLGKTVAVPEDGTNQLPNGQWNMTTNIDMNDPAYFPTLDGTRTIFILAEDPAGNVADPTDAESLDIFIDTRVPPGQRDHDHHGPSLRPVRPQAIHERPDAAGLTVSTSISWTSRTAIHRLSIRPSTKSWPPRRATSCWWATTTASFLSDSIQFIDSTVDGDVGMTTVRLFFAEPLPDDRFTLTISDRITDVAFNALDGESNALEPQESPSFPTGDGGAGRGFRRPLHDRQSPRGGQLCGRKRLGRHERQHLLRQRQSRTTRIGTSSTTSASQATTSSRATLLKRRATWPMVLTS